MILNKIIKQICNYFRARVNLIVVYKEVPFKVELKNYFRKST